MYYYCPTSFTKHPDLEVKSRVRITNIPADSSDPVVHIPCCMWAEIYANEVRCMNCGERAPQTWIDVANLSGTWTRCIEFEWTWEELRRIMEEERPVEEMAKVVKWK
jgi:hypothetical protein